MKKKETIGIILTLIAILLTTCTKTEVPVNANPIPRPALIMPYEYINVTLSVVNGSLLAKVYGAYPFGNAYYPTVDMYYPVPPDAANISVQIDETPLTWMYNDTGTYQTVIGDWPFINWTISSAPTEFTIKTYYEHAVPLIGENYTFLYAMGTGRFLETYAKECTAYVRARMETNYSKLHAYSIWMWENESYWTPRSYNIVLENMTEVVTLTIKSYPFYPLMEDILLTFDTDAPILGDADRNGIVDGKDLAFACKAFNTKPGDPKWNPIADLNRDNKVDGKDIALVAKNFGETQE